MQRSIMYVMGGNKVPTALKVALEVVCFLPARSTIGTSTRAFDDSYKYQKGSDGQTRSSLCKVRRCTRAQGST